MNLTINIFDTELVWKGLIDSVISLTHRTSWHEMPNSDLKISRDAANVSELQVGRILVVNNQRDKALIIESMQTDLNAPIWTFNLIPLKGMLNYRICHPSDTTAFTAKAQSNVMMNIASGNLVTQTRDTDRKFWNAARTKNMFGVTTIKNLGDTIDFSVDWKTGYMADALVSISKMHGEGKHPIGWNIYIDDTMQYFYMDCYQGTDRTIDQAAVSPVVFSEEFGNISNASYEHSMKDWRNVAYMSWNNGTADQITSVGNTTLGATVSFMRKEIIVDSSKTTTSEVTNEGKSQLNASPHIESFTAEIINNINTMSTYGVDWHLGDIVTIQSAQLGNIQVNAQVTEIEEIFDNGLYSLNATFNEGQLNLIQKIKNELRRR